MRRDWPSIPEISLQTYPIQRELTKAAIRLGSRAPEVLEHWEPLAKSSPQFVEPFEKQGEHYRASAQSLYHRLLGLEAILKAQKIEGGIASLRPDIARMRSDWSKVFDTNVRAFAGAEEKQPDGGFYRSYTIEPVKPWFPRVRAVCHLVARAVGLTP